MPFSIKFKPMRAAVVDLDPELSDVETQTVIGLTPSTAPSLFLFDIKDAPMYIARRGFEVFRKRRKQYAEAQTRLLRARISRARLLARIRTASGQDSRTASGQDSRGIWPVERSLLKAWYNGWAAGVAGQENTN
ncbi:hypothetical protein N9L68_07190 [bacterium]|nr:hypothetical protein [bacterium]